MVLFFSYSQKPKQIHQQSVKNGVPLAAVGETL